MDTIQFIGSEVGGKNLFGFVTRDREFRIIYGDTEFPGNAFEDLIRNHVIDEDDYSQCLRRVYACLLAQIPWKSKELGVERSKLYCLCNDFRETKKYTDISYENRFRGLSNNEILDSLFDSICLIVQDVDVRLFDYAYYVGKDKVAPRL